MSRNFSGTSAAGVWLGGHVRRFAVLACAVSLSTVASGAPSKLDEMAGYWTGTGTVTMSSGATEQLKCVVTYKVTGSQLRQNVRCASPGYSINGTAELQVAGSGVTGSWEEKTYSATGTVLGRTTDDGFRLAITAPTFSAAMNVVTSACRQTISIAPKGLDVTQISIGLGKC